MDPSYNTRHFVNLCFRYAFGDQAAIDLRNSERSFIIARFKACLCKM